MYGVLSLKTHCVSQAKLGHHALSINSSFSCWPFMFFLQTQLLLLCHNSTTLALAKQQSVYHVISCRFLTSLICVQNRWFLIYWKEATFRIENRAHAIKEVKMETQLKSLCSCLCSTTLKKELKGEQEASKRQQKYFDASSKSSLTLKDVLFYKGGLLLPLDKRPVITTLPSAEESKQAFHLGKNRMSTF